MENFYLSALIGELRRRLVGRYVGAVFLSSTQLVFELRPADGETLFVSLDRTSPTVFLSSKAPKQLARESNSSSPFAAHLKKHVAGAVITAIDKPPLDRIVHIEFEKYDLAGNRERARLVLAMTGRSANGYLFDSAKRLMAMMDERGELARDERRDVDGERFDTASLSQKLSADRLHSDTQEGFFNGPIFNTHT